MSGTTRLLQDDRLSTVLWRGRYLIVASVALAVGLAVFVTMRSAKVYEATAIIQVNSSGALTSGGDILASQLASQSLATTYAQLIDDRSFLEEIRPDVVGGSLSAADLQRRLTAKAIEQTGLIELKVEGSSPAAARRLVGGIAEAFLDRIQEDARTRSADLQAGIQTQIADLSTQIEELTAAPGASSDPTTSERVDSLRTAREALTSQLARIVASGIEEGSAVTLTAPPSASSSPIRPRPVLNITAGVLLGLLLGFALAWLRGRLDRGLHSSEEAEDLLGVPILASIPIRKKGTDGSDPALREAYDVLRANLAFLAVERALQVVTFTSYNPDEGKSSVVEGLAHAAVRAGMSVLVIDGDLRNQTLSGRFGRTLGRGLTNVLIGAGKASSAIVSVAHGFSFLPAGAVPPNPPSLLASERMQDLVAALRDQHTLVLIDSPPVAHLADASILASMSDGVVLVARVGQTRREELPSAIAKLRHSPAPIVGAVVLEPRPADHGYYYHRRAKADEAIPNVAVRS